MGLTCRTCSKLYFLLVFSLFLTANSSREILPQLRSINCKICYSNNTKSAIMKYILSRATVQRPHRSLQWSITSTIRIMLVGCCFLFLHLHACGCKFCRTAQADCYDITSRLRENIQQTSFVLCPEMKLKLNGCRFDRLKDISWSLQRHKWKGREGGESQKSSNAECGPVRKWSSRSQI